jgi:DNA-binding MarR family transcriptional regulator
MAYNPNARRAMLILLHQERVIADDAGRATAKFAEKLGCGMAACKGLVSKLSVEGLLESDRERQKVKRKTFTYELTPAGDRAARKLMEEGYRFNPQTKQVETGSPPEIERQLEPVQPVLEAREPISSDQDRAPADSPEGPAIPPDTAPRSFLTPKERHRSKMVLALLQDGDGYIFQGEGGVEKMIAREFGLMNDVAAVTSLLRHMTSDGIIVRKALNFTTYAIALPKFAAVIDELMPRKPLKPPKTGGFKGKGADVPPVVEVANPDEEAEALAA